MNSKTQFKVIFPNILTTSRIVLTPIIVIFGLFNNIKVAIILTAIAALTDLFDGYLARKWHVTSSVGAKLDAVSDKIFAIGIVLSLVRNVHLLILILLLEVTLACLNVYFFKKTNITESLLIGKIKTTSLFITLIFCFIYALTSKIYFIADGFMYMTINLQILSILSYIVNYQKNMALINKKWLEENIMHNRIMNEIDDEEEEEFEDLDETIKLDSLRDLQKRLEEQEGDYY